jgi:hypothetical protein
MAMASVSRTDNLAQFMNLVSAARQRNDSVTSVNNYTGMRKTAFANRVSSAEPTRENAASKAVAGPSKSASMQTPVSTRYLGTRFDAYA